MNVIFHSCFVFYCLTLFLEKWKSCYSNHFFQKCGACRLRPDVTDLQNPHTEPDYMKAPLKSIDEQPTVILVGVLSPLVLSSVKHTLEPHRNANGAARCNIVSPYYKVYINTGIFERYRAGNVEQIHTSPPDVIVFTHCCSSLQK